MSKEHYLYSYGPVRSYEEPIEPATKDSTDNSEKDQTVLLGSLTNQYLPPPTPPPPPPPPQVGYGYLHHNSGANIIPPYPSALPSQSQFYWRPPNATYSAMDRSQSYTLPPDLLQGYSHVPIAGTDPPMNLAHWPQSQNLLHGISPAPSPYTSLEASSSSAPASSVLASSLTVVGPGVPPLLSQSPSSLLTQIPCTAEVGPSVLSESMTMKRLEETSLPEGKSRTENKWRWHFFTSNGSFTSFIGKLECPEAPIMIPANGEWKCLLHNRKIREGWFEVVFCIAFANVATDDLETLSISLRQVDESENTTWKGVTFKNVFEKDELNAIALMSAFSDASSDEKAIRLRLHNQIGLYAGGDIEVVANMKSRGDRVKCRLNYIEMYRGLDAVGDIVLYGQGKPQQFVNISYSRSPWRDDNLKIHSCSVSCSGLFAVTLSIYKGNANVEVWELDSSSSLSGRKSPRSRNEPFARGSFGMPALVKASGMDISLSVSSSGSQVTLISKELTSGIPFQIFKVGSSIIPSCVRILECSVPCDGLVNLFGYGAFVVRTTANPQEMHERFIVCDGYAVSIYNTSDNWSLLHNVVLSPERNLVAAFGVVVSVRDIYFAWTGNKGVVSIWDMDLRKFVSHIQLDNEEASTFAHFSRDGFTIAVCSKGRISIHQTSSGIKLGEYDHAAGNESYLEVNLENDHFVAREHHDDNDHLQADYRSIVYTRDVSISRKLYIHRNYKIQYPSQTNGQVYVWRQGSKMNVICMETTMTETAVTKSIEHSQLKSIRGELLVNTVARNYNTSTGPDIRILPSQGNIRGTWGIQVRVTVGVSDILAVPLGPSGVTYRSVFLKGSTRILFITGRYLQLWDMSTAAVTGSCKLELIWALQAVDEVKYESSDCCLRTIHSVEADDQGKSFKLLLDPPKWFRGSSTLPKDPLLSAVETITFPMSKLDNLSISEQDRIELGVRGSVEMYVGGDKNCRKAVIQYLENIVRSSPTSPTCCVTVLCRLWKPEEKVYFEEILSGLLPLTRVTWVPNADIKDRSDPLSILFKKADSEPAVIGTAKVIMNYCVNHAKSLKNLALLSPIFTSMREVMTLFPEEAFRCLGRIAFIPVKQRSYIINNHTIAHPPKLRLQFWKPVSQPLHKSRDPIMQLDISLKRNPLDAKFANPIFMASFDALWSFHGSTLSKGDSIPVTTVWWHALFYMIKLKLRLRPETYVECYDFNLEYFDNPSIAALISYKWNTIGFVYWLVRFVFQCIFYCLVVTAAIMQVYNSQTTVLLGVFIGIIFMSAVFIWLEILQILMSWKKYKKSTYNVLDLVVFLVPMGASIHQIVVLAKNDSNGNVRALSFSVLIVFLHMLFELRINKSVCKYVTIIQQAILEMKVFFFIFAGGLVAFTIGMLHLLRGCPMTGCSIPSDSAFPVNFFEALSSTYFFMGGRYDPVSDRLSSQDWGFHIMMAFFFFFTVILMMNVLIALINVAFNKGDDSWRLAWVESRVRFIESAENMSYQIPGFRQTYNWFPKEIYFTATTQKVNEYLSKHGEKSEDGNISEQTGSNNKTSEGISEAVVINNSLGELQKMIETLERYQRELAQYQQRHLGALQ